MADLGALSVLGPEYTIDSMLARENNLKSVAVYNQERAKQMAVETAIMQQGQQQQQALRQQMQAMAAKRQAAGQQYAAGLEGLSQKLGDASNLAIDMGDVKTAASLGKLSGDIEHQRAQNFQARSTAEAKQAAAQLAGLNVIYGMLNNVSDQASLEQANELYERFSKQPSPLRGAQYNPQMVQQLKGAVMTEYQRQHLNVQNRAQERMEGAAMERDRYNDARLKLQEEALRIREEAMQNKKAGSPYVGAPNKMLLNYASQQLKTQFPDLKGTELSEASFAAASRAREITKTNKGINDDQALRQAVIEIGKDVKRVKNPWMAKVGIDLFSKQEYEPGGGGGPIAEQQPGAGAVGAGNRGGGKITYPGLNVGDIKNGYRYVGGHPKDKGSWEKL